MMLCLNFARRRIALSVTNNSRLLLRKTTRAYWISSSSIAAATTTTKHHPTALLLFRKNTSITVRSFHSTSPSLLGSKDDDDEKKKKKGDDTVVSPEETTQDDDRDSSSTPSSSSRYETINNTSLSDEEIEKIIAEEEEKMILEEQEKFVKDWKPGMRKRHLTMSYNLEDFEYDLLNKQPPRWTLRDKRCGALAIKVGMMPVFDDTWGVRYACTVLFLDNNVVLGHKTVEKHGYLAVQVAAGQRKRKNVSKAVLGQYQNNTLFDDETKHPPYLVREFRVTDPAHLLPLQSRIHARHFVPGQNVDVSGISKGKGFQGAMKRHNFKGMPASHGVSKSHRALGSTGQCQDPGKVFKGKKMAGRMGGDRVTVQNLRIVKIDRGRNLLYVEGAVPGNKGCFVEIRDAVKKPLWKTQQVLGGLDRPPLPTFEYDETIDGVGGTELHEEFMPLPDRDPLAPEFDDEAA